MGSELHWLVGLAIMLLLFGALLVCFGLWLSRYPRLKVSAANAVFLGTTLAFSGLGSAVVYWALVS